MEPKTKVYVKELEMWMYKKLVGEGSLTESENNILDKFIVQYIPDENTHLFTSYESNIHFFIHYIDYPKYFYETIMNVPQKMRYDIDISIDNENITLDFCENLKDRIIEETIKILPVPLDKILICTSHGISKYSYHIIFNAFYLSSYEKCLYIYDKVVNELKNEYGDIINKYVDRSIYKKTSFFRLLFSEKPGSNRPKEPNIYWKYKGNEIKYETMEYIEDKKPGESDDHYFLYIKRILFSESLIAWTDVCKLFDLKIDTPSKKIPVIVTKSQKKQEIPEIPEEDAFKYFELLGELQNNLSIDKIQNNIVLLRNNKPYLCPICHRIHEHDNPYLLVTNETVYFYCRRSSPGYKFDLIRRIVKK
jgi:hypothetical protein